MAWRKITGGLAGFLLWWFLFFVAGIGIGVVLPDYREAARLMFQEGDMSGYTTPLLLCNYFLFITNGLIVGLVTTLLSKSRFPVYILTGVFFTYMIVNHYVLEWDSFPGWYNLMVPFIVAGAILLGCLVCKSGSENTHQESDVSV